MNCHKIQFGRKSEGLLLHHKREWGCFFFSNRAKPLHFLMLADNGRSENQNKKIAQWNGVTVDMEGRTNTDILSARAFASSQHTEGKRHRMLWSWKVRHWICQAAPPSHKHLLVDPHECARVIGFALILDAVEAISPLAVVPLVVVVKLHLPHCFKQSCFCELKEKYMQKLVKYIFKYISVLWSDELMTSRTGWTDRNTRS